jgi:hypothetical protein
LPLKNKPSLKNSNEHHWSTLPSKTSKTALWFTNQYKAAISCQLLSDLSVSPPINPRNMTRQVVILDSAHSLPTLLLHQYFLVTTFGRNWCIWIGGIWGKPHPKLTFVIQGFQISVTILSKTRHASVEFTCAWGPSDLYVKVPYLGRVTYTEMRILIADTSQNFTSGP